MKNKILAALLTLSFSATRAQEPTDALRYSWLTPGGSARGQAVGSATTALGGDFSSLFNNPAGLGLYKTGEFSITPGFAFNNTKAGYLNNEEKQGKSAINYGAMGLVTNLNGSRNGKWSFTLGLGLNRVANFNNSTYFKGINNQSSYSEKYLEELIKDNVTDPNSAAKNYPYGSSLAFNTFLIDTIQGPGGSVSGYKSLANPQNGLIQEQRTNTKGGIVDYGIGVGASLMDKLYIGASLGLSGLKYDRTTEYTETDATKAINNFNHFTVDETLHTVGQGINLKLGLIFKPVENLRIGLSYQTPTQYNMKDLYTTTVTTDLEGYAGSGKLTQSSLDFTGNEPGNFQYTYHSPSKAAFGVAYVLNGVDDVKMQKGFITADIEYINYASSGFSSIDNNTTTNDYFNNLNNTIKSQYKKALNYRIGGELKFNTIMVRAGVGIYGNPYSSVIPDKGSRMTISGGLGYRNKGYFVDLTYVHQISKDNYYPYRLADNVYQPANFRGTYGNLLLTLGVKF
jgi:hypothetical protein